MKAMKYLGTLALFLGVLLLRMTPVHADPPLCTLCASGNWYCDSVCRTEDGGYSTCGDEGYSCVCHPNVQMVSQYQIGGWAIDDPWTGTCQYYASYQQNYHDLNNCPGSQDSSTCTQGPESGATASYGWCCTYYNCFGQTC